jgi:hypothetical protein
MMTKILNKLDYLLEWILFPIFWIFIRGEDKDHDD